MDKYIKRATESPLWEELEKYHLHIREWRPTKTVCLVTGPMGAGKTTWLLNYFKNKSVFYFSFDGLEEGLAERLFAAQVSEMTGRPVSSWAESFTVISAKYRVVLLDDLAPIASYKRFHRAFYDNMITNIDTRPFVAFIHRPGELVDNLADEYAGVNLSYFSVPEVMKVFPTISKHDILGLCAVSGGVPNILRDYDVESSFKGNLQNFLEPDSAFCRFMPELMGNYFRKPENYNAILWAIANGNHRVSEIGKFTGFAYNKCDNYLSSLIQHGIVKSAKVISPGGAEKTVYKIPNSYFRLWYRYIFSNRTAIQRRTPAVRDEITRNILDCEIHAFHVERAFALANARLHWELWPSYQIESNLVPAPQTVRDGDFRYTFDAIVQNEGKAVFVKIFENPEENCRQEELARIRRAMALVNTYYDSHVLLFAKRRFSSYAEVEAVRDDSISLVIVDRLKY